MDKINIKNICKVEKLTIPIPDVGGVVVMTGGQGVGKSTVLRAVSKGLGGSTRDLSPRDGTTKGEMWMGDVKLTVTRGRQAVKGELEVESLEGRFDISRLVDPGIQDPLSADGARIKALIAMRGAKANPADFYEKVGGKEAFDALGIDADTADPIVLAGRLNRALQAEARKLEKISASEFATAKVKRGEVADVDMSTESDRDVLQKAYNEARDSVTLLAERDTQYQAQQKAIEEVKSLEAKYDGPSVEGAQAEVKIWVQSCNDCRDEIDRLRKRLREMEEELERRMIGLESVQNVVLLTLSHEETVSDLKKVIESAELTKVTTEDTQAAECALADAQEAVELGVKVRDAKIAIGIAKQCVLNGEQNQNQADSLRDKAKDVDQVLSDLIPAGSLRIDEGRLVTATDRSSAELYADLSDGERAAMAIEVAVANLPSEGLLIAPQWMWEGWTKSTRDSVNAKLQAHGVVMLTAEAVDGELTAEPYQGEMSREPIGTPNV